MGMSVLDVSAHRILQGKEDVRQEGNMEKLRSLLQEKKMPSKYCFLLVGIFIL